MITELLTFGTWALGLVGGTGGLLGIVGMLLRIPWVGGAVSAIPIVGPLITKAFDILLGWLDSAVRWLFREWLAPAANVLFGHPKTLLLVFLMLWGTVLYFDKWKYRGWQSPDAVAELQRDVKVLENEAGRARPSRRRRIATKPCLDPLSSCFWGL